MRIRSRDLLALGLVLLCARPAQAQGSFYNWETPPVHPVEMTPDGTKLLVTNTADARLDYARSLAMQGKNTEACAQYEALLPVYAGDEARCRYALLLQQMGVEERAQELFREIVESAKDAPGYYRRRQREWINIAKQNLRR